MPTQKYPPLSQQEIARLRAMPGMRVRDAKRVYPIGKNTIYKLMREGRLSFVKIGHSTILNTQALEDLVAPKCDRR
jgi:excisionase family DNA binding protein